MNVVTTGNAVVTGGTGGIGLEVAIGLAKQGYDVTVIGRNEARGAAALDRIRAGVPTAEPRFLAADLSSQTQIRRLAATLRSLGPIDLLINNVGGLHRERWYTEDGIEATFFLTHLSGYLLTELLLDHLIAAGHGRIVLTASGAAAMGDPTPFDQADVAGAYYGLPAYGRAMLATLAYTQGLAERLKGTGVTVTASMPAASATDMGKAMRADLVPYPFRLAWPIIWLNLRRTPPARAARPTLIAATMPDLRSGQVVGTSGKVVQSPAKAVDPAVVDAVQALSRSLAPIAPPEQARPGL
jgi:NAD(P)-dependent dehydrogenase (short-subunit alcohol dehydrogenase family)